MKFNLKIVQNKKIYFIIAAAFIVVGLLSMIFRGFYLDIDFAGGTEITYHVDGMNASEEAAKFEELAREVVGDKINVAQQAGSSEVIVKSLELDETERAALLAKFEEYYSVKYPAPVKETEETVTEETVTEETVTEEVTADVEVVEETTEVAETETVETEAVETEVVEETTKVVTVVGLDSVSGSVSKDLRNAAVISVTIAVILMLIYITIRFQFSSALAAIICLCHDVLIVLAAYSIFQIPVSSSIIAVILTILGYSINATIVVFDRVRENVRIVRNATFAEKVNISINQTLLRSINTTLTTLFTIGMIYVLGVQSIKEFAFPIIVGLFAGLYSSTFLAGSFWSIFKRKNSRVK